MKESILRALSKLYPFGLSHKLGYYKGVLQSFRMSAQLRSCGSGTRFSSVEYAHGLSNVSVGKNTAFLPHLFLTTWGKGEIVIGDGCSFGAYCHLSASNGIHIGNHLLTGKWVSIVDNDHGKTDPKALSTPPILRELFSKGPIRIGDNVWIGDKVTFLSGVTIGDGAVIATNAVVTKDVLPYTVVGGIPARVIKQNTRTDETN